MPHPPNQGKIPHFPGTDDGKMPVGCSRGGGGGGGGKGEKERMGGGDVKAST